MISASRTLYVPPFLRPRRPHRDRPAGETKSRLDFIDPWLVVCDRCPLFDCVLPEGGLGGVNGPKLRRLLQDCPAERAKQAGWQPDEALSRAGELGLLEDEK